MTAQAISQADRPPLTFATKLSYGIGSWASGSKNQLLGALLFYYTQIQDLSPAWVGLALGAANIIDAFWDPALGQWSDSTRSRLGRRACDRGIGLHDLVELENHGRVDRHGDRTVGWDG